MYIDDGSAGDSGELNIDVDGHEYAEESALASWVGNDDLLVDTDHGTGEIGSVDIGPATVDTDDDGHPDTAVVHDARGDTVLYTDSDGDGHADTATELTPDGQVIIADEGADHEWAQAQHGHLTSDGQYQVDSSAAQPFTPPVNADSADDSAWSGWAGAFSDAGSARGVVRIDATTGQWISQN
ncbi:MAG TPA: hypothetical protein VFX16_17185 [Pseudonocardiaceae bacterium]|nr:hypothetical protein [Pseudonocardiaceae bacterium]